MGPQPKRCHHCKSTDHLIADCPGRRKSQEEGEDSKPSGDTNNTSSDGSEKKAASDTQQSPTNSNSTKEE